MIKYIIDCKYQRFCENTPYLYLRFLSLLSHSYRADYHNETLSNFLRPSVRIRPPRCRKHPRHLRRPRGEAQSITMVSALSETKKFVTVLVLRTARFEGATGDHVNKMNWCSNYQDLIVMPSMAYECPCF